jgi:hypothetical protein
MIGSRYGRAVFAEDSFPHYADVRPDPHCKFVFESSFSSSAQQFGALRGGAS